MRQIILGWFSVLVIACGVVFAGLSVSTDAQAADGCAKQYGLTHGKRAVRLSMTGSGSFPTVCKINVCRPHSLTRTAGYYELSGTPPFQIPMLVGTAEYRIDASADAPSNACPSHVNEAF